MIMSSKKSKKAGAKSPAAAKSSSNTQTTLERKDELTTKISFQSRNSGCPNNTLLLNTTDAKLLDINGGNYVLAHLTQCSLLFRVVVQSKVLPATVSMNRLWQPTIENEKDRVCTLTRTPKSTMQYPCSKLTLFTEQLSREEYMLPSFISYLRAVLVDTWLFQNIQLSVLWRGSAIKINVVSCESSTPECDQCGFYHITPQTTITFQAAPSLSTSLSENLLSFGGYESLVTDSLQVIADALHVQSITCAVIPTSHTAMFKAPRGMLLWGPRGTGKSKLMRLLAASFPCHIEEITPAVLLHKFQGEAEAEIRAIFSRAQQNAPSIILMDDIDIVCKQRQNASEIQYRILSCLLTILDGFVDIKGVFVIATSANPQEIDTAIRRPGRIDKEYEFTVPSAAERESILHAILRTLDVTVDVSCVAQAARMAHGMVPADLQLVCKEALLLAAKRAMVGEDDLTEQLSRLSLTANQCSLTNEDLLIAVSKVTPSAIREVAVEVPEVKWTDIGGMETVKQSLREVVEWPLHYPELFDNLGISPPRGVLLYGPPGCSKTLMAKALATESGMNFLTVRGPELLSKWLGDSEKAVQLLFKRARAAAPSLIFFDEIDALATKRGDSSSGVNDRVLSQLLTEIDGVQSLKRVVVVAATNRPDMLDAALLRPGRIDRKIYVHPPDFDSRVQIVEQHLKKMPCAADIDINRLAHLSEGFSGAEVVSICTEAAVLAVHEGCEVVEQTHLEAACADVKPQITKDVIAFYDSIQFS